MSATYWLPRAIALSSGFLSLSQELAWVRFVSFLQKGTPYAFAAVLAVYLLGIAVGAWAGKRFCDRRVDDLPAVCGLLLVASGAFDFVAPWLAAWSMGMGKLPGYGTCAVAIVLSSAFKSAVFPIVHHMGSQGNNDRLGRSVSTVYFANILGSTAGPLVTGLFLFDVLTLQQVFFAIGAASFGVGIAVLLYARPPAFARSAGAVAMVIALTVLSFAIPQHALVHSMIRVTTQDPKPVRHIVENRHGILHALQDPSGKDWIYGGNEYDGRINTELLDDVNDIWRVYLLAAAHTDPKRVLNIGLSAGPWTRVLSGIRGVESLDVVEINPGYLELTRHYPAVRGILTDPRVRIHVDDGRRWLKRHPEEKFDLIVMNTTFHFRAYTTLLLSREFLADARRHLRPGGLMAWNSTTSGDVFKTAAAVFPYVYKAQTFVVAGNEPVVLDRDAAIRRLRAMHWGDDPVLKGEEPELARAMHRRFDEFVRFRDELALERRPLEVITDQNMITEFRYGRYRLFEKVHRTE